MGRARRCSYAAVPLGGIDGVLVVEEGVVVVSAGVGAEHLAALGIDALPQTRSALIQVHGGLGLDPEDIGGRGDLAALPLGLEEGARVAVGLGGVAEVGGDDEAQRHGRVAGALYGHRGLGGALHEHDGVGSAQSIGPAVASPALVDALLIAGHEAQSVPGVGHLGIGGHLLAGVLGDALLGAHGVQDAPGHVLIAAGLDPLIGPLVGRPGLDPVAPRRRLRIGEDESRDRNRGDAPIRRMKLGRAGVVDAHAGGVPGRLGAGSRCPPLLPVPGAVAVVGVAVGQADGHLILVDVVIGIGQAAVPDLAAVAPLTGAADVVEVIEGVARPRSGDGGDQRTLGLLIGQIGGMTEVLQIGQGAGRHELSGVAQIPLIDEVLGLTVVEDGNIRLRLILELGLVITPLEPLNGIDITTRSPGRENGGKSPAGSGGRGGDGGDGARAKRKSGGGTAHGDETHDTAA